jgi:hypothetical protein
MDLMELLGGRPPENEDAGLTPIQVVTQLREVMAQTQEGIEQDDFLWGDVLQHRFPSLANTTDAESPVLFVEYLDSPIDMRDLMEVSGDPTKVFTNASAITLDCKVMKHVHDMASVFFANSAHFRLHPDFPRNAHAS